MCEFLEVSPLVDIDSVQKIFTHFNATVRTQALCKHTKLNSLIVKIQLSKIQEEGFSKPGV
jgi:hypothetical protein